MIAIDDILQDSLTGHSDLQMLCFVTAKHGHTKYGAYKQALMELRGRHRNVELSKLQIAGAEAELDELRAVEPRTRKQDIDIQTKELQLRYQRDDLREQIRERDHFYAQAVHLRDSLGLTAPMTDEQRNAWELEFWEANFQIEIASHLHQSGIVPSNLLNLIRVMPDQSKQRLLGMIGTPEQAKRTIDGWMANPPIRVEAPRIEAC